MFRIAPGISYIDLDFQGQPRTIGVAVLDGPSGVALVDPGPASALPSLRRQLDAAGIAVTDIAAILLTHIHLDHAGATGTLLAEHPAMRVFVHERGAPHLENPAKLLASAARLYGADMERLWGEVRPVSAGAIVALAGGERVEAGGRTWDVRYTPGHASHHVSYFSADAGTAFVGDTAGVKITATGPVVPPTPPPDIDLDLWRDSLKRIAEWSPETLFLTHFGPSAHPRSHLAELGDHLEQVAALAQTSLARDEDDRAREAWFIGEMRRLVRRRSGEAEANAYELAGRFDLSWKGLARYWRGRS